MRAASSSPRVPDSAPFRRPIGERRASMISAFAMDRVYAEDTA
jgi:hypothetical protein